MQKRICATILRDHAASTLFDSFVLTALCVLTVTTSRLHGITASLLLAVVSVRVASSATCCVTIPILLASATAIFCIMLPFLVDVCEVADGPFLADVPCSIAIPSAILLGMIVSSSLPV